MYINFKDGVKKVKDGAIIYKFFGVLAVIFLIPETAKTNASMLGTTIIPKVHIAIIPIIKLSLQVLFSLFVSLFLILLTTCDLGANDIP